MRLCRVNRCRVAKPADNTKISRDIYYAIAVLLIKGKSKGYSRAAPKARRESNRCAGRLGSASSTARIHGAGRASCRQMPRWQSAEE